MLTLVGLHIVYTGEGGVLKIKKDVVEVRMSGNDMKFNLKMKHMKNLKKSHTTHNHG